MTEFNFADFISMIFYPKPLETQVQLSFLWPRRLGYTFHCIVDCWDFQGAQGKGHLPSPADYEPLKNKSPIDQIINFLTDKLILQNGFTNNELQIQRDLPTLSPALDYIVLLQNLGSEIKWNVCFLEAPRSQKNWEIKGLNKSELFLLFLKTEIRTLCLVENVRSGEETFLMAQTQDNQLFMGRKCSILPLDIDWETDKGRQ